MGHELNSQGFVSGNAGASDEPDYSSSTSRSLYQWWGHCRPVPDSFSEGALRTTESPAAVRELKKVLMFISAQPSSFDRTTLVAFTVSGSKAQDSVKKCILLDKARGG